MNLAALPGIPWDWEPSVVWGCALLVAAYLYGARPLQWRRVTAFAAGVAVLLLSLVSPLDTLADHYLFSAHMVQHLLLLEAVPPLLLLGLPAATAERILRPAAIARLEARLRSPLAAGTIGAGTLILWHLPVLYDAAVRSEAIHIVEHLCFLLSATIFWWPVLAPIARCRLASWAAVLYLFAFMAVNSVVGIVVTFAPVGFYKAYLHPVDSLHLLPLIRNGWGLSTAADQQLGGIVMWVPGGLIYMAAMLVTLGLWLGADSAPERALVTTSEIGETS